MLGLFSNKRKYATISAKSAKDIEENTQVVKKVIEEKISKLWEKCPSCDEIVYKKDIEENLKKCPKCDNYFIMTANERIELLIDEETFIEFDKNLGSKNVLNFIDYDTRLEKAKIKTSCNNAVVSGLGEMNKVKVSIAVMDFDFMGGSMGSVVGEKITRAIERGIEKKVPVVIVSSSGGARMQEGIFSLMQMAKTSAALDKLRKNRLPFISVPVHPTTGGVTASFAMLGDVNITEPKALIAFAGPRVIEQTIKQKLPKGFQKAEFLLEHGMIDIIAKREDLKDTISKVLSNLI